MSDTDMVEITHRYNEDALTVVQLCEKIQRLQDEVTVLAAQKGLLEEENKKARAFMTALASVEIDKDGPWPEQILGYWISEAEEFLTGKQEKK